MMVEVETVKLFSDGRHRDLSRLVLSDFPLNDGCDLVLLLTKEVSATAIFPLDFTVKTSFFKRISVLVSRTL